MGVTLLTALILTLATACGSGGGTSGGNSAGQASSTSLGFGPPPAQIPATPADVPSGAPGCTAPFDQSVSVPSALQSLVSACSDAQDDMMELTNLSQLVLDVIPAPGTSPDLEITKWDTSSDPLPTPAGDLEVEAQNAVVEGSIPSVPGAVLLPVGGIAAATTTSPPVQLLVGVDTDVSTRSYAAAALTSYIVSNIPNENPDDYYKTIADCVNDTYNLWNELKQQPPPTASQLLIDSLQAAGSCTELRDKVKEYLENSGEKDNLATEAQLAGEHAAESDWASEYDNEDQIQHELMTDGR